jgi:hypothetical protein
LRNTHAAWTRKKNSGLSIIYQGSQSLSRLLEINEETHHIQELNKLVDRDAAEGKITSERANKEVDNKKLLF